MSNQLRSNGPNSGGTRRFRGRPAPTSMQPGVRGVSMQLPLSSTRPRGSLAPRHLTMTPNPASAPFTHVGLISNIDNMLRVSRIENGRQLRQLLLDSWCPPTDEDLHAILVERSIGRREKSMMFASLTQGLVTASDQQETNESVTEMREEKVDKRTVGYKISAENIEEGALWLDPGDAEFRPFNLLPLAIGVVNGKDGALYRDTVRGIFSQVVRMVFHPRFKDRILEENRPATNNGLSNQFKIALFEAMVMMTSKKRKDEAISVDAVNTVLATEWSYTMKQQRRKDRTSLHPYNLHEYNDRIEKAKSLKRPYASRQPRPLIAEKETTLEDGGGDAAYDDFPAGDQLPDASNDNEWDYDAQDTFGDNDDQYGDAEDIVLLEERPSSTPALAGYGDGGVGSEVVFESEKTFGTSSERMATQEDFSPRKRLAAKHSQDGFIPRSSGQHGSPPKKCRQNEDRSEENTTTVSSSQRKESRTRSNTSQDALEKVTEESPSSNGAPPVNTNDSAILINEIAEGMSDEQLDHLMLVLEKKKQSSSTAKSYRNH